MGDDSLLYVYGDDQRVTYGKGSLDESTSGDCPFNLFSSWFNEHQARVNSQLANLMSISTVSAEGRPHSRHVLLGRFSYEGFVFFTNYHSQKGKDLETNPFAQMLFFFEKQERSIKVEGVVKKISKEESLTYFKSRPRESQLAALVSRQSHVLQSRQQLEDEFEVARKKYQDRDIPLPDDWGGYCLEPNLFEFWQGRASRLHDRLEYRQESDDSWVIRRLYP